MFFQLALVWFLAISSCSSEEENTTLLLVQTLFRHGDRAPIFLYPNDPNTADHWPEGLGELTQLGKEQNYAVGKFLRSLYKDFITSNPNEVLVFSASEDRCLNSAEAYLAAFYTPDDKWEFHDGLHWQPIPIHYKISKQDIYLNHRTDCLRYKDMFAKAMNSEKIQEFYRTHKEMVEAVKNFSGMDYTWPKNAYRLYNILHAEITHNVTIPDWVYQYWGDMSVLYNELFLAAYQLPLQIRLLFGPFLGSVNHHIKNKINGKTPDLKFIINTSHGVNLAGVLFALNFTSFPRPPYCATLMFELHQMADESMTVRLRYINATNPLVEIQQPNVLVLEGCSEFCPVDFFMKSYQWLIPDDLEEECKMDTPEEVVVSVPVPVSGSCHQTRPICEKYTFFFVHIFSLYLFFTLCRKL